MTTFQRILCPVDFSPPSEVALTTALSLAKDSGGRVTVLHVVETPDPLIEKAEFLEWITRRYDEQLSELLRLRACAQLEPKGLRREGRATEEIQRAAAELAADLIVIGTHGRSGIRRWLLGSVAERVVRTARIPVLTVPMLSDDSGSDDG